MECPFFAEKSGCMLWLSFKGDSVGRPFTSFPERGTGFASFLPCLPFELTKVSNSRSCFPPAELSEADKANELFDGDLVREEDLSTDGDLGEARTKVDDASLPNEAVDASPGLASCAALLAIPLGSSALFFSNNRSWFNLTLFVKDGNHVVSLVSHLKMNDLKGVSITGVDSFKVNAV